ncbi:hypothetical protein JQ604_08895 [Bradyrhizobium jicamae]|uniref:hypothetical protein n=1 Tax=Bradyrhizobium jicamae TaxID=280332 RepID=UPI001BA63498|nr:hypothetical protein [Bradyrhizobium jicamae]MBR0752300.1 hypothetical protein [Bradyrhizobium jicamae]
MTLLYQNEIRLRGTARARSFSPARVLRRLGATLRMIHRAIAAAKIRRLRNELRWHAASQRDGALTGDRRLANAGQDAESYPRQPVVLGEKWDY